MEMCVERVWRESVRVCVCVCVCVINSACVLLKRDEKEGVMVVYLSIRIHLIPLLIKIKNYKDNGRYVVV